MGRAYARLDQARARPVIKLTIGNPGRGTGGRTAVADFPCPADVAGDFRGTLGLVSRPQGLISLEQGILKAVWVVGGGATAAVTPGYRHAYLHGS